MEGVMIGNVSIINPKLVTGPRSTSTIEIRTRTHTAMEKMISTAVTALSVLNPHLRIRDERKNQDSKKRKRSKDLILPAPIDASSAATVSDVTGIKGKYKLADPGSYKIEPLTNPSKHTILGPLTNPVKSQQSVVKMLQFVEAGKRIDFLA